jgi:NADH:ubiquinone oxidoreductase subunit 2 (subunit N)
LYIAMLSLAGVPGTGGFLGKFFVFGSALQMNLPQTFALALVGILTSVVAAFYYLNVVRQMFFETADEGASAITVPMGLKVGLVLTAAGILIVGLYPDPFIRLATNSIHMLAATF